MPLCLEDYVDSDKKYDIDDSFIISPDSSLRSVKSKPSGKIQGFCSERTLGLFKRNRCVVFAFAEGNFLKMALMGNVYNLSDDDVKARVKTILPLAKQFTLLRRDEIVVSFNYWFFEWKDYWPECDIFPFIERITHSPESKKRVWFILNELAAGGDVTKSEFLARLEAVGNQ